MYTSAHWSRAPSKAFSIKQIDSRGVGSGPNAALGAFSNSQNDAILIVGVVAASISLLAAFTAVYWFTLMRRSFRHHLILLLILSDMFKALWYFIFPIVVFTQGPVASSSDFCQSSGFLLALATEASDFAILMIAAHAAITIFRPPGKQGEAGLWPYRLWMYGFWVALPALAASLAFTNPQDAYVTAGTLCYLPKRPFWYRLALSYIPRYLIFITIFVLYAAVSIYVNVKFNGFSKMVAEGSSRSDHSQQSAIRSKVRCGSLGSSMLRSQMMNSRKSSAVLDQKEVDNHLHAAGAQAERDIADWEKVEFITALPLRPPTPRPSLHQIATADFAPQLRSLPEPQVPVGETSTPTLLVDDATRHRKASEAPTIATNFTGDTVASSAAAPPRPKDETPSQMQVTRRAILRQLRLLFVYPAAYVLMWMFPFVSHCLQYSDYYAAHPPFWLSVVATYSLALQAGVDCALFSWMEKPWRRVSGSPLISARRLSKLNTWTLDHSSKSQQGSTGSSRAPLGLNAPGNAHQRSSH